MNVILRPERISDARFIHEWMNEPETVKYLGYGFLKPRSPESVAEELALRLDGEFTGEYFTVEDASDGEYMGQCALIMPDTRANTAEISLVLRQSFAGRGAGTRALKLLLDYAFNQKGYRRLYIKCAAANEPAIRLYERAGFKLEGVLRQHLYLNGELTDVRLYGLLDSEYRANVKSL